jgi:hypothetical protein
MVLILRDLQRTIDPLIAAQVYNNNYSPLIWLPNELLLYILHCLGDDIVTLLCLQRVSRIFWHLIEELDIWKYLLTAPLNTFTVCHLWHLPREVRKQFQQRLYRDGMCNKCKLWCIVHIRGWEQRSRATYQCQFKNLDIRLRPYCIAYSSFHEELEFSKQQCLGRQGAVQLCRHVHISWATIEAHIANWQPHNPRDWQACLNHFNIKCYDLSHDTRCSAEESPTWSQACLQNSKYSDNLVVLNSEWKLHSGLNAFTPTPGGQALASELRVLFSRYQQGAASTIFFSYPSNPLPEMACFPSTIGCNCLSYERGEPSVANSLKYPTFSSDRVSGFRRIHSCNRGYGYGYNLDMVDLEKH